MDPRHRLKRRYPGQGIADPSPLFDRLIGRDKPLREERESPGSKIVYREVKSRHPWRMAEPSPNAPLLKRMVRYPYRQELTWARREQVFEPLSLVDWGLDDRPLAFREAQAERGSQTNGNPLKTHTFRVETRRSTPSVSEWLAGREG